MLTLSERLLDDLIAAAIKHNIPMIVPKGADEDDIKSASFELHKTAPEKEELCLIFK